MPNLQSVQKSLSSFSLQNAYRDGKQFQKAPPADRPQFQEKVVALYAHQSDKPFSLSLTPGDVIRVTSKLPSGWWEGVNTRGSRGWFPSNFTQAVSVSVQESRPSVSAASGAPAASAGVGAPGPSASTPPSSTKRQASTSAASSGGSRPSVATVQSSVSTAATSTSNSATNLPEFSDPFSPAQFNPGLSPAFNNGIMTFEINEPEEQDDSTPRLEQQRDLDADSLAGSTTSLREVLTPSSRKGSVTSYVSQDNDSGPGYNPSTVTSNNLPGHFLDGYSLFDPAARASPSHWIAQVNQEGKLCYVNTDRKQIVPELPFEAVGPTDEDDIPQTISVPPEILGQPDILPRYSESVVSSSEYGNRGRKQSVTASIDSRVSTVSNTFTIPGLESPTWSGVLALLGHKSQVLVEAFTRWDEPNLVQRYNEVAQIVQTINVVTGIPVGAVPVVSDGGIVISFRSAMSILAKVGLFCDIVSIKRRPSGPGGPVRDSADSSTTLGGERFSEMIANLNTEVSKYVTQYKALVTTDREHRALTGNQDYSTAAAAATPDDTFEYPSPQSLYQVRQFKNGTWVDATVTNNGQAPTEVDTRASITSGLGITTNPMTLRQSLFQLEAVEASTPVNSASLNVLREKATGARGVIDRILNIVSSAEDRQTTDAIKSRKKVIAANLNGLQAIIEPIFQILESLDLSLYYGGQRRQMLRRSSRAFPAKEAFSALTILFNFLDAKQAVFTGIVEVKDGFRQSDSSNADFIAAISAQFDQAKLEELYSSFEKSVEDNISGNLKKLRDGLDNAITTVENLAEEQRSFAARPLQSFYGRPALESAEGSRRGSAFDSKSFQARQHSVTTDASAASSSNKDDGTPWFLQLEHGDEMVYDRKGAPRGGTIRALVEQLTLHDKLRPDFNNTMLLTFRSFTDASELFDLLVDRFSIQPPEGLSADEFQLWTERKQMPIRIRVVNILKQWLETYWLEDDIEEVGSVSGPSSFGASYLSVTGSASASRNLLLDSMLKFANQLNAQKFPGATTLINLIENRTKNKEPSFKRMIQSNPAPKPVPLLPKNMKKLRVFDIEPQELARQLTLREFKLFVVITAQECLNRCCGRKGSVPQGGSQNIGEFIHNSNHLTNWVTWSILNCSDAKRRAQAIKYFITTALYCKEMNNFSSMTAIISGLYSSTIHRMKKTWELVSQQSKARLDKLNTLMNSSRNFNDYRDVLSSVQLPAVPFFGVYLTDLTFTEDGNPDFLQNDFRIINFAKRAKAASTIENIRQFQRMPYNFEQIEEIQHLLKEGLESAPPIDEQYDTSLAVEPREKGDRGDKGERVAKLLEENGIL